MKYIFMSTNSEQQFELPYFNYCNASPLISIHIPTYKKKYLNIGYDFTVNIVVLAYLQTFDNWELRLIDNHDGDLNLAHLFDEVEKILNRPVDRTKVLYQRSSNDRIGSKRNELIQHTIAPIICNWDDDDLYLPEYLSTICKFYEDNPYRVGIVVGRRWQYNLFERQRLIWSNNICNGAGYYILRTDAIKQFANIKYAGLNKSEEVIFLHELIKTIKDVDIDGPAQLYPPIDRQYVRMRFGGNITDQGGWENDIRIKNENGGYLMNDFKFEWLFSKVPIELHDRYRELINRLYGREK